MAAEGAVVASQAALEAMLLRCPFHRWLGLRVVAAEPDHVEVEMPWREELVSNPERNIVHGGILASVIDAVGDLAIGARLGHTLPTIDLHVDYHKAAGPGPLRIVGRVVSLGRTVAVANATVLNPEGALLASGRGAYLVRPPSAGRSD